MAKEVAWDDRFKIGVDEVDSAHKRLFGIVGKIIRLNEDEKNRKWVCQEGIKFFKSYAIKHFASEEMYMKYTNYDGYEMHKQLHDNLRDLTLPALEQEMEESDYSPESVQHFLGICIGWLNGHIMIEDRAIVGRVSNKWVHSLTADESSDLQQAVSQSMQEVFGLKTKLVSAHYGGEDIGKSIFYRLNFLTKESEKLQIFLGYEERLVLQTLGEMLQKQLLKMDQTVMYAMMQISQVIADRVGTHFTAADLYKLEKNNMLTYSQMLMAFEREYPRFSLLFDTGRGYFVFCIRQTH
ncbi:MAG: hypothetical protein NC079_03450 [Clostridium sp.]|nr:hypothetical protein [Acetatifactor muris]MCM1526203.1 hypothetical protein [Bacteroides sp.]MCM1562649.1 hypothetical protein [Clostridium sp.]